MTFEQEEKEVLNLFLQYKIKDQYFNIDTILDRMVENNIDMKIYSPNVSHSIELIIRPECNQQCSYCYITQHGKELYPLAERISRKEILQHIDILLDYFFNSKHLYINTWEFFAGDLFYDNIYFDIIDIYDKYLKQFEKKYPNILHKLGGLILTPCNFSFIADIQKEAKLKQYIDYFQKEYNWELGFSISTDGKYAVDSREKKEVSDEIFEKMFQWSAKYPNHGFHAMLSPYNIKNSVKNYFWWKEQFQKYIVPQQEKRGTFLPYWLEVRNDDWDKESIDAFINLLNVMIQDRIELCDNDIDEFTKHLFGIDTKNGLKKLPYFDIISIVPTTDFSYSQRKECSLTGSLCITVNNYGIVPCHRLTYKNLVGGYFVEENGKIVDVKANNVPILLNTNFIPASDSPRCMNCDFNRLCHKGCCGAQYEASGELFEPCESVCDLQTKWHSFLLLKYDELGVFKSAKEQGLMSEEYEYLISTLLKTVKGEKL